jgi:hypothetical protein
MAKKLSGEACVRRELIIDGIPAPVSVELTRTGIRISVKGSKKWITVRWPQVISASRTSSSVPAYLMDRPMEFLLWQARNYKIKGRNLKQEPKDVKTKTDTLQLEMWPD